MLRYSPTGVILVVTEPQPAALARFVSRRLLWTSFPGGQHRSLRTIILGI